MSRKAEETGRFERALDRAVRRIAREETERIVARERRRREAVRLGTAKSAKGAKGGRHESA